jgi:ankyrin repeat protein
MIAARNGHLETMKFLLENNVDVNLQNKVGHTANARAKLQNGNTALYWAADSGHFKCLKLLVENGADLDLPRHVLNNANGRMALHHCIPQLATTMPTA